MSARMSARPQTTARDTSTPATPSASSAPCTATTPPSAPPSAPTSSELRIRNALRAVQQARPKDTSGGVKDIRSKKCGEVLVRLNDSYALGRGLHSYRRGAQDASYEAIKFIRLPAEKDGEEKKPVIIAVSIRCLPHFQRAVHEIKQSAGATADPASISIWDLLQVGGCIDASLFSEASYPRTRYLVDKTESGVTYSVMVDSVHYSTGKSNSSYEALRIIKTTDAKDKATDFSLNFPAYLIPAIDRVLTDFVEMDQLH